MFSDSDMITDMQSSCISTGPKFNAAIVCSRIGPTTENY